MHFCSVCQNMYYIRLKEENGNKLIYYCRNCGNEEENFSQETIILSSSQFKKGDKQFSKLYNGKKKERLENLTEELKNKKLSFSDDNSQKFNSSKNVIMKSVVIWTLNNIFITVRNDSLLSSDNLDNDLKETKKKLIDKIKIDAKNYQIFNDQDIEDIGIETEKNLKLMDYAPLIIDTKKFQKPYIKATKCD